MGDLVDYCILSDNLFYPIKSDVDDYYDGYPFDFVGKHYDESYAVYGILKVSPDSIPVLNLSKGDQLVRFDDADDKQYQQYSEDGCCWSYFVIDPRTRYEERFMASDEVVGSTSSEIISPTKYFFL